ncbi:MAG: amidohydrolase [Actinomycetota bacterium]
MTTTPAPDLILVGGVVEPIVGETAEAVAVGDGLIAAVGSAEDVLATRASTTEVVDLAGATVLPGLIEPHTHPDLCAQMYAWVDVSGFTHPHVSGVQRALEDAIAAADPGEWVYAFGLDFMLTDALGIWDRDRLDAIAPANPLVVMIQSMHTLYVNSAAFAAAGIDESTPQPSGGGHWATDHNGRLNGKVEEQTAMGPFLRHGLPDPNEVRDQIREQYRRYAEVGITTLGLAGAFGGPDQFDVFPELAAEPDVALRVVAYLRHQQALRSGGGPTVPGDAFRIAGVKLWYDGSPYTGTMLLDEPYLETDLCCCTLGIEPGTNGRANFDPVELTDILGELHGRGWQVLTHAQGDRACREILDLYDSVLPPDAGDHRWRLEHCALITDADLARAAGIGVSPSFHVDHVRYYGPELASDIIGPERAEGLMPVRSALDCGHRPSLHADSPMYPPGPLRLAGTASSRHTRHGEPLAAHQAISVEEAVRAVTIDAAWQLRMDDEVGSIEPGKRADFAVLEANPLRSSPTDLEHISVTSTWLGGREVRR